jgi:DNA-binding winged helix-turn-helix (wHTH) protein
VRHFLKPVRIRFGPFTLDSETRQLHRGATEIHLARKPFDLLVTLLTNRPKVMDKDQLQAAIWPDSHVDAAGLNVLIGDVRRALGDDSKRPQFIRTVHGVGYAFCCEQVHVEAPHGPADRLRPDSPHRASTEDAGPAQAGHHVPSGTNCWLVWDGRTFRLSDGENVIGRDPSCHVWLDAPRVSRRHASIVIDLAHGTVFLSDLGSTNGTFLGKARVEQRVALADGDDIRMGSVALKFRRWIPEQAPDTRRIRRKAPNR